MEIKVERGLIFAGGHSINCPLADQIAQANGFAYAEFFVKEHTGKTLEIDEDLKIVPNFEQLIVNLSKEWATNPGHITCETSLSARELADRIEFLAIVSARILAEHGGKWVVHYCETCKGHDPKKPFHAEIIKD